MKTKPTLSTNFVNTTLWVITLALLIIAGFTFYYASLPDTTWLGDPYYMDQILAPQRAFVPWAFTILCLVCSAVIGVTWIWSRHKR